MAETIYGIWIRKAEFLPPDIVVSTMYTLYGCEPDNVEQWDFLGPAGALDKFALQHVRTKGFCLRELSKRQSELMKRLHN